MPSLWTVHRLHLAITALTLSLAFLPTLAYAQAIATGSAIEVLGSRTASATTNDAGPSGIIPFAQGFPSPYLLERFLHRITRTTYGRDACITGYLHDPWPQPPSTPYPLHPVP